LRCGAGVVEFGFTTGTRVHQAAGELALEDVVQTGLIAADTGVDAVGLARRRLVDEIRVGQEGRAIDTMSAQPLARMSSATSGVLMRLVVISGIFTCPISFW
jgi:hypothetical protein